MTMDIGYIARRACLWGMLVVACAGGYVHASDGWDGPNRGPVAQPGKSVVFIASDLRNGSVGMVYRGLQEAAQRLGWTVSVANGAGDRGEQARALTQAVSVRPNAIVFGGFDPDGFEAQLADAEHKGIVLVGWHAAKAPGPTKRLFVNVTTDALDVARAAANFVIQHAVKSGRTVGVVLFNDDQFAVANAKTEAMRKAIEACVGYKGCKVLGVENVRISDANTDIPRVVPRLVRQHGSAWTYSLAINDAYFDAINYPLRGANRNDILNVSAGDGSKKALSRIAWGHSQQLATVAEPLKMQGYQLADELNRAFAGDAPSGYVSKPILVTNASFQDSGSADIESGLGFEQAYGAIWAGR